MTASFARRAHPALLLGVALLVFATNLQGVILPIRGHERGASMVAIGLFSSAWSAGFVTACLFSGAVLGAIGHVRAYAVLAIASAAAALLFVLVPRDGAWIALRLASGFCYGGASVIVESWILDGAERGSAFATYMIANLCASLCGTLSLDLVDPGGAAPFVLAAATLALSPLPVALGRKSAPPPLAAPFRPRLLVLIRHSPEAAVFCLLTGIVTGALGGLAPLFGAMLALGMTGTTLMLAANSIGGALAYAPLGFLTARVDRASLLGILAGVGVLLCLPIVFGAHHLGPTSLILLLGALGFVQYPLYGLAVGRACDDAPSRPSTEIASEALLLFGAGTIVGPILGGQVMRSAPENLFAMVGALFALLFVVSQGGRSIRPTTPVGSGGRVPSR